MAQRLRDTLLDNRAYARGHQAPMVNLQHGGQFGHQPNFQSWVSNAAFVRRNLIPILVAAPRGFDLMDNPDFYRATLKALVEEQAKSIDGLMGEVTVETAQNPFGGAGEMQEDPTNVIRAQSNPTFTWQERYGRAINAFLESWITNLIMDPNSKTPAVMYRNGDKPTDMLPDWYSMTMCFIEPDPTHTKVVKAWLCTNMYPKSAGPVEGRRDITTGGETLDLSIQFSALTQHGNGVNSFAQRLLDEMSLTGANPNHRPAFIDKISEQVRSAENGYREAIANAARSAIQP